MSIPEEYAEARAAIGWDRLVLPGAEIEVFPLDGLTARQAEYGKHPKWRPHWLAIGVDHSVGDAIFINVKDAALPVLTWMPDIDPDPWMVAASPRAFFASLESAGENGADPEQVLAEIDELNDGAVDLDFWASILNQDLPAE